MELVYPSQLQSSSWLPPFPLAQTYTTPLPPRPSVTPLTSASEASLPGPSTVAPSSVDDANGDGYSNLMHYALGVDPEVVLSGSFAEIVIENDIISLQFDRLMKTPDLNLTVQISTDLLDWSSLATLTDSEAQENGLETVTYKSPIPLSSRSQQFFRIWVTQNP